MKNIRILCLTLVFIMLLSFVSCGDVSEDTNNGEVDSSLNSPAVSVEETTDNNLDADGYWKDDLPSTLNYSNATFNILFDKDQLSKTLSEDLTGVPVNDALYYRIMAVEERLGVKLNFIALQGAWNNRAEFAKEVERSINSGDEAYDAICAYNLTPPTMAVQGTLYNLNDTKYLNFDQPWWPKQLLSESVYADKLFFCADNSSWNVIRNMHVIVYESKLVEKYNIPDPMKTVIDGKWTMELLKTYIDSTYSDLNGNGTVEVDSDQFGLATDTSARMDGYFFAAGLKITDFNASGDPEFQLDDEKVGNFVSYMSELYHGNPNVTMDSSIYKMFKEQRAVFYETAIAIADQQLTFDYGVVPIPKFNDSQEGYVTGMSNTYDMWCLPKNVKNTDMSSAVLECMASEAYRKVTPAYFEIALKVRYASSGDAGEVFDIIRAGMTFNFGYVYGNNFSEAPFITVRNCILNNTSWTTAWKSVKKANGVMLQKVLDALKAN